MKKLIVIMILTLSSLSFVAAKQGPSASQTIAGFIQNEDADYMNIALNLESIVTNGNGVNLDVADTNNKNRFLISPSTAHELGLKVGTFSIVSTQSDVVLRVYHTKMSANNGLNLVDYELGLSYSLADGTTFSDYCTGVASSDVPNDPLSSSANSLITAKKMLELDLAMHSTSVILVQQGGIFFRLSELPTVKGNYKSTITFVLGPKTT